MKISKCRACGAQIVWIRTTSGKSMPCDAEPVYYQIGNQKKERIITPNGETLACEIVPPDHADGVGYRPHWSTCPSAGKFKKPV